MPLEAYQLDYRKLQEYYPELKQVEWVRFADIPAYRVIEGENERYIDASGTDIVPLDVPCCKIVAPMTGSPDTSVTVPLMAVCAIPLRGNNIPTNQTHIRVYDSIVKLKRLILSLKTFALQRYYNSQKHTT